MIERKGVYMKTHTEALLNWPYDLRMIWSFQAHNVYIKTKYQYDILHEATETNPPNDFKISNRNIG